MSLTFATDASDAIPLFLVEASALEGWMEDQPPRVIRWLDTIGFKAALGSAVVVPNEEGQPEFAVAGFGDTQSRARGRFPLAAAAAKLPKGTYKIASDLPAGDLKTEVLGWLLTGYSFDRYRKQSPAKARLICPEGLDAQAIETIATSEALTRDLINTPAADMGPEALEAAVRDLAKDHEAKVDVISGDDLLAQKLPMIHAVGRAAEQAPRLIDLRWGNAGPSVTLVGKGVCFDTGGLNLKPGASMGLMKKDMGGAATVLGLARMIMAQGMRVRLRVLIPAVENSVSGNSFRPGDILSSRKGLTVEINNTDAEGRLVLADALTLADEENPDVLISMATLTGAARVAVGADLAPYYSDDPKIVSALENAATAVSDPVWRMPFWTPYEPQIEPGIADLDNAPKGGFAGSITAALFLRRFVDNPSYTHFDIYGWHPGVAPARTKGGVGMGARALLEALPEILDLT
ncbi:leucyl aminopeptidase family protein [Shimia thalassica]|uniref:leucyl aminopeptidase family protein n=1 Tax=Shimia thalassica TaxID=1715693 RepID=UPI0027345BC3|nr:leucyl aminopeptidase family protein [Shimia thalassica]MDP2517338.1 leucyl aminopeptidase family protein [Shimia thalassica]